RRTGAGRSRAWRAPSAVSLRPPSAGSGGSTRRSPRSRPGAGDGARTGAPPGTRGNFVSCSPGLHVIYYLFRKQIHLTTKYTNYTKKEEDNYSTFSGSVCPL